ncbi:MAG: cyclic pyranopterin monophosphate synthase MoaC [Myxococcales bacterium]|nr:cyclic pyranopterin monophosphate synthase MoaC [Myxococcales bacterium]
MVAERLTHLDTGGHAHMVAVEAKPETHRTATAEAIVKLGPAALAAVRAGTPKGDALQVARLAGIQAAKRTAELIPLCHPLRLTHVAVQAQVDDAAGVVRISARVEAIDRTGVEMEALVAASVAALALYDMIKAIDRAASIERVVVVEKTGGRSGHVRPHG